MELQTKSSLLNELAEVKAALARVEEKLNKSNTVSKVFVPKEGESYWGWNPLSNMVYSHKWCGHNSEALVMLHRGQVFRTESEAKAALNKQLATVRVLNKLRELEGDWVADWNDRDKEKFSVFCDYEGKGFLINVHYTMCARPSEWYSTKEAWQWVIDNMADDLKLAWGISNETTKATENETT